MRVTDVILPMVYPALYWPESFEVPDPNADPYLLVKKPVDRAVARTKAANGRVATIRPWLQAFAQRNPVYGSAEMQAQIQVVEDAGLFEWLFWNPNSVYLTSAFK